MNLENPTNTNKKEQNQTQPESQDNTQELLDRSELGLRSTEQEKGFVGAVIDQIKNPEVQKSLIKDMFGAIASIAGIKSLYDVPAYFHQKFELHGTPIFGDGLEGSIEEVIEASQEKKHQKPQSNEVQEKIKALNKKLKLTEEGTTKGSPQRDLIAKLLKENRQRDTINKDERKEEIDKILDEYTTQKVTGVQAARESLNTALVVGDALALRAITSSLMDGVARYQKLNKDISDNDELVDIVRDVLYEGVKETIQEAMLKDPNKDTKTDLEIGLDATKSWAKIARYIGMGATANMEINAQEHINSALDKLSNSQNSFSESENFARLASTAFVSELHTKREKNKQTLV